MHNTEMLSHTHTCILYTCGNRDLKTQIISEDKVEKWRLKLVFKCMMFAVFGGQGVCCPRVCGLGTRCVTGED